MGAADATALTVALARLKETYDFLGSPEGELALAQACVHLATAPQVQRGLSSRSGRRGRRRRETGSLMPPAHIRSGATKAHARSRLRPGYQYDPDTEEGFSGADYWPEGMAPRRFYDPRGEGAEGPVRERLERWAKLREESGREARAHAAHV